MNPTTPFATAEELAAYWKPLSTAEIARATVLLNIASVRLRAYDADPSLDTRAEADDNFKALLNWITMEAVKRAMITPNDEPSIESKAMSAGVYSENVKYVNPTGDLFFRKSELAALGLSGSQRLGSIEPVTQSDFYGSEEEVE